MVKYTLTLTGHPDLIYGPILLIQVSFFWEFARLHDAGVETGTARLGGPFYGTGSSAKNEICTFLRKL